jgi:hypothetical protein
LKRFLDAAWWSSPDEAPFLIVLPLGRVSFLSRKRNNLRAILLLWAMRARLHDYEETRVIIPTYLTFCVFICGVLGWGFFQLMQPAQYPNPGIAVYEAPPGIGITSLPPRVQNESDLEHPADETTGRATQSPQPESAIATVSPPQIKSARQSVTRARKRENITKAASDRREMRQVQHSGHFSGFGGAYPGYAALH